MTRAYQIVLTYRHAMQVAVVALADIALPLRSYRVAATARHEAFAHLDDHYRCRHARCDCRSFPRGLGQR